MKQVLVQATVSVEGNLFGGRTASHARDAWVSVKKQP
jgi:hypothetical protein